MASPKLIHQVGGGISGLSTAYCLGRSGHNVTIVDQAPVLADIGAGIQIGPSQFVPKMYIYTVFFEHFLGRYVPPFDTLGTRTYTREGCC